MSPGAFVRAILSYLRPYWVQAGLVLLGLLLEMAFNALVPYSFKYLIDQALIGGDREVLLLVVAGLGAGAIAVSLAGLGRDFLYARLSSCLLRDLRHRLFVHLQRLSMDFHARYQAGDLLSRFTGDLAAVEHTLISAPRGGILPLLDILASTTLLFALDWRLALVAMLVWPLGLLGPRLLTPRATQASYGRRQDEARLVSNVQENLSAQGVIKAFRLESSSLAGFLERNARLAASVLRLHFLSALVEHSSNIGLFALRVLILGMGAYMAFTGRITVGELAAFQPLFINLTWGIFEFTQYVPQLVQAGGGMERLEEVWREQPRVNDAPGARSLPRLTREIAFQEVSFGYNGDRLSLDRVSFSIPRGRSAAFVGPSGSGKSTVLNLILRFYDPGSGAVKFDGRDLRQVTRESLCQRLGVVFQDNFLFNTSIRENIRLGRPAASDGEVEAAARAAELHGFIAGLPQGYDTLLGEDGMRLSGGQRQRLGIARAILRDPEILLLDEATSALDPRTEAAINATLEKLARGRTVISVTHRLSSAANMDHIFVLERGKLVEQGTHRELLNLKGAYHRMWREFALELTQNVLVGDLRGPVEERSPAIGAPASLARRIQELEEQLRVQQQEVQRLSAINQRWTHLAGTDSLTGLPNKIAFLQALVPQQLQQAQRRHEPMGFILLSGDGLGQINENYSRDAGDQLLRGLAEYLQSILKGEELLGHIDGTHFAVVFSPASLEEAHRRAEQLRLQVERHPLSWADTAIHLTLSAGVASIDSAAVADLQATTQEILRQLNGALYAAKKAGGNRVERVAAIAPPGPDLCRKARFARGG